MDSPVNDWLYNYTYCIVICVSMYVATEKYNIMKGCIMYVHACFSMELYYYAGAITYIILGVCTYLCLTHSYIMYTYSTCIIW